MAQPQVLARSLNDLGLAAWFGGTLMGATGLNQGAAGRASEEDTVDVASAGWSTWAPLNLAAIGAHVAGAAMLAFGNKSRVASQAGVASVSSIKLGLTIAALAATGYSRLLGKKVEGHGAQPARTGVEPADRSSGELAQSQHRLAGLQWAIPALTGGMLVCDAILGEQQRGTQVVSGILSRLNPAA